MWLLPQFKKHMTDFFQHPSPAENKPIFPTDIGSWVEPRRGHFPAQRSPHKEWGQTGIQGRGGGKLEATSSVCVCHGDAGNKRQTSHKAQHPTCSARQKPVAAGGLNIWMNTNQDFCFVVLYRRQDFSVSASLPQILICPLNV